ncbi:unnamed protein product [Boreogadus saida]
MPVRRKDAQRALVLLEAYQTKLSQTDDRQLKHSIQRVIDIFQSNLFQALIDIQEFYEVTLLDSQKCADPARSWEPLPPVNLWDLSSLQSPTGTSETLPSISTSIEDSALLQEIFHALAQGKDHASGPTGTSIMVHSNQPSRALWGLGELVSGQVLYWPSGPVGGGSFFVRPGFSDVSVPPLLRQVFVVQLQRRGGSALHGAARGAPPTW